MVVSRGGDVVEPKMVPGGASSEGAAASLPFTRTSWTLLCPGPSLAGIADRRFEPQGPVVAVNNAVLAPVHCDFWCMQDGADVWRNVAGQVQTFRRGSSLPTVWCKETQKAKWLSQGYRVWSHGAGEEEFRRQHVRDPAGVRYTALTMLAALARMTSYGPAVVHLYGCDLTGTSYGFGTDLRSRADDVWKQRWESERTILNTALDRWLKHGHVFLMH